MDLAWRYPVIVQVVSRKGRDMFYGTCPDFGLEVFEVVDPGNNSQEFMFQLKLRRQIQEALSVHNMEKKELPPVRSASLLTYSDESNTTEKLAPPDEMVSTSDAAKMLGVHPETIRRLFDSGSLAGALSKGGQRLISVAAINKEKAGMKDRAELRKLELRIKKTNAKRKQKLVAKELTQKEERFQDILRAD